MIAPGLNPLFDAAAMAAAALVSAVWQGVLLAAAVALVLRLIPAISAAARSAVWLATFALAALLDVEPLFPVHGQSSVTGGHAIHVGMSWAIALAAVWLGCSVIRAGQLVVSALYLLRIGRESRVITHGLPASAYALPRRALVCASDEVDRPCVAGFFQPRILFPATLLESLSQAEIEQVLLHETEHLRRGDDWTNLAQKVALVLFPLNPVLLWVERRLCLERELACDDRVLSQTAARKAYAICLTSLAEHTALTRRLHQGLSLALGAWERRSELASRVYRILTRPEQTLSGRRSAAVTGFVMAGLMLAGVGLAHAPMMVSFMPVAAEMTAATSPGTLQGTAMAGGERMQLARAVLPMRTQAGLSMHAVKAVIRHRGRRVRVSPLYASAGQGMPLGLNARYAWQDALATAVQGPTHDGEAVMHGARSGGGATAASGVEGSGAGQDGGQPRPVGFVTVVRYAAVPVSGGWLLFQL